MARKIFSWQRPAAREPRDSPPGDFRPQQPRPGRAHFARESADLQERPDLFRFRSAKANSYPLALRARAGRHSVPGQVGIAAYEFTTVSAAERALARFPADYLVCAAGSAVGGHAGRYGSRLQ